MFRECTIFIEAAIDAPHRPPVHVELHTNLIMYCLGLFVVVYSKHCCLQTVLSVTFDFCLSSCRAAAILSLALSLSPSISTLWASYTQHHVVVITVPIDTKRNQKKYIDCLVE